MDILLATQNNHKKEEIKTLFPPYINLNTLKDIGFNKEIEEIGKTFKENAFIKAKVGYNYSSIPTFSDDSGLVIPTINNEPGIFSARYSGTNNDKDNIKKVLQKLKNKIERKAYFICVICFFDGKKPYYFEGKIYGEISYEERGINGFGYDPIFIPNGYNTSFGELSSKIKNTISHRTIAMNKFILFIKKNINAAHNIRI